MMKLSTIFLALGVSSSILFTGCCGTICKPEIRYETKYIKQEVPSIPLRPVFQPYEFKVLNFDGFEYYVIDPTNAAILGSNWESSKSYTKKLEIILNNLDNNSSINTK